MIIPVRHVKFVPFLARRWYRVLALESSCDDSCLALLEKQKDKVPDIIDQVKNTLNSSASGGIIPPEAVDFHQKNMAKMVAEFSNKHGFNTNPPDLICCTRGPGMTGSLSTSLQLAKGLAIAWNKPLIGVHHMLGHILISQISGSHDLPPQYPYLSLLCSGGHTMLVLSKSLTDHEIVIDTMDIAVGDSIDKCARELGITGNLLGLELEKYVHSIPIALQQQYDSISTETRDNQFHFKFKRLLVGPKKPAIPDKIEFTFAPFLSNIQHYISTCGINDETKQFLSFKIQKLIFQHIIDRVNVSLLKHGTFKSEKHSGDGKFQGVNHLILSGGVASNKVFRDLLEKELKLKYLQPKDFRFHFPDVSLCTDNAVMIGVAGIEIYEKLNKVTDLGALPIRKWPLDRLMEVGGWVDAPERREGAKS